MSKEEIIEALGKLTLADVRNKALITQEKEEQIARDVVQAAAKNSAS